jgi:hypothetical protein
MRMVTRTIPAVALVLALGAARLAAQQNENFQWYIGGQGGIMNFATPNQTRGTVPLGGAHLMVKARRTGLYLAVDQGFGSNELSSYSYAQTDASGAVTGSGTQAETFNYIRRYTAMLVAFPVKGHVTPFFGIGGGIVHTGGHNPDDDVAKAMGSSGFGSLMGGVQIYVSRFMVFGQYQVQTEMGTQHYSVTFTDGSSLTAAGGLTRGVIHTLSAGVRFNLGDWHSED